MNATPGVDAATMVMPGIALAAGRAVVARRQWSGRGMSKSDCLRRSDERPFAP